MGPPRRDLWKGPPCSRSGHQGRRGDSFYREFHLMSRGVDPRAEAESAQRVSDFLYIDYLRKDEERYAEEAAAAKAELAAELAKYAAEAAADKAAAAAAAAATKVGEEGDCYTDEAAAVDGGEDTDEAAAVDGGEDTAKAVCDDSDPHSDEAAAVGADEAAAVGADEAAGKVGEEE